MTPSLHPFTALTENEILHAAEIVRASYASEAKFRFKATTLSQPTKVNMVQYRTDGVAPPRKAWINYYQAGTAFFYEAIINLSSEEFERHQKVPAGLHGPCDDDEIITAERIVMEDPRVKAEIKKLHLPPGAPVIRDPWIRGAHGQSDTERQYQCYMYLRDPQNGSEADSNHYAFPLSFSPLLDAVAMRVTRIDHLPTGAGLETEPTKPIRSVKPNEHLPELKKLRTDLKELVVTRPNGASSTIEGDVIRWQKWEFRMTFNYREGMVLHKVSYNNRRLFYRVSLSDMSIPYADSRAPFHKKQAFDLGDTGAVVMANDLKLGCDCLGAIAHKDGLIADHKGKPLWKRNAVCIHEQDMGLWWKHTKYRNGRAAVVRRREL